MQFKWDTKRREFKFIFDCRRHVLQSMYLIFIEIFSETRSDCWDIVTKNQPLELLVTHDSTTRRVSQMCFSLKEASFQKGFQKGFK